MCAWSSAGAMLRTMPMMRVLQSRGAAVSARSAAGPAATFAPSFLHARRTFASDAPDKFDVVVVGGGPGGYAGAIKGAQVSHHSFIPI
eukprot:1368438-Pleurochrysis_carterae.AAC.2